MGPRAWILLGRLGRGSLRLALPVAVVVAVLVGVRMATPPRSATTTSPAPAPTYQWHPYAPGYGPTPSPTASPTPDAEKPEAQLAERFVTAWLDTAVGKALWLARLQPLAAEDLYGGLALTDLHAVPHGRPRAVVSVTPTRTGDTTVVVATTAGDLRLYVARRNAGDTWQVNNIEPAVGGTA